MGCESDAGDEAFVTVGFEIARDRIAAGVFRCLLEFERVSVVPVLLFPLRLLHRILRSAVLLSGSP